MRSSAGYVLFFCVPGLWETIDPGMGTGHRKGGSKHGKRFKETKSLQPHPSQ